MLDFDGSPVYLDAARSRPWCASVSDADEMVTRGDAVKYGSKRRAIGIRLLSPIAESKRAEEILPAEAEQSALTPESYGKRYTVKEHVSEKFYLFQFSDFNRRTIIRGDKTIEPGTKCMLRREDFLQVLASVR